MDNSESGSHCVSFTICLTLEENHKSSSYITSKQNQELESDFSKSSMRISFEYVYFSVFKRTSTRINLNHSCRRPCISCCPRLTATIKQSSSVLRGAAVDMRVSETPERAPPRVAAPLRPGPCRDGALSTPYRPLLINMAEILMSKWSWLALFVGERGQMVHFSVLIKIKVESQRVRKCCHYVD